MSQALWIKQVKSHNKSTPGQAATVKALGLKGVTTEVYRTDTRAIRGMLNKVQHLVEAKQVSGNKHTAKKTKVSRLGYVLE